MFMHLEVKLVFLKIRKRRSWFSRLWKNIWKRMKKIIFRVIFEFSESLVLFQFYYFLYYKIKVCNIIYCIIIISYLHFNITQFRNKICRNEVLGNWHYVHISYTYKQICSYVRQEWYATKYFTTVNYLVVPFMTRKGKK